MEGLPKPYAAEKPPDNSRKNFEYEIDSVEAIESALKLSAKVNEINQGGDVYGPEAMAKKAEAGRCEADYIAALEKLSDTMRDRYHLPQRSPAEKKLASPESNVISFPATPPTDYAERLGYVPVRSGDHSRVDSDLPKAA